MFSIRVFIDKAFKTGQKQDFKIQSNCPVFNIIKITLDPLPDRSISPIAIDLCPSGQCPDAPDA